jgi:cation-transporting P-type ATPase D
MEEARGISRSRVAVVATAAACVVVASGVLVFIRKRRCEKQEQLLRLVQEDKPQKRFKRVLADNSDAPFQHLASPVTGIVLPFLCWSLI